MQDPGPSTPIYSPPPSPKLPHYPRAPSPVPTLIIDEDQADTVERVKKMGVKVRDYAEEPRANPTPEVYRMAVHDLANWDAYLRKRYMKPFKERGLGLGPTGVHGKVLRRLLAMGWITEEERQRNFLPNDTAALQAYDSSPSSQYPWRMVCGLDKPTPLERRDNWRRKFPPRGDDIPESEIFSSTPVTDEEELEHRDKRARTLEPLTTPTMSQQPSLGPSPPTPPRQPLISHARRGTLARTKTMASF